MDWQDKEFKEAVRLLRKFFPECKSNVSEDKPLDIFELIQTMKYGTYSEDFSCEPFNNPPGQRLDLNEKGGFTGSDIEIFKRLLKQTNFKPVGRAIVIPDTVVSSMEDRKPYTCSFKSLTTRLKENDDIFDGASDSIFAF